MLRRYMNNRKGEKAAGLWDVRKVFRDHCPSPCRRPCLPRGTGNGEATEMPRARRTRKHLTEKTGSVPVGNI